MTGPDGRAEPGGRHGDGGGAVGRARAARATGRRLDGHHRVHAVRAHLLELDGEVQPAIDDYEPAADLTASLPEQHYLITRAARLRYGGAT